MLAPLRSNERRGVFFFCRPCRRTTVAIIAVECTSTLAQTRHQTDLYWVVLTGVDCSLCLVSVSGPVCLGTSVL